jgi:hypothetical protein
VVTMKMLLRGPEAGSAVTLAGLNG